MPPGSAEALYSIAHWLPQLASARQDTHVRYAELLRIRDPENKTPMGRIDLR
jgi:hypothetical protein